MVSHAIGDQNCSGMKIQNRRSNIINMRFLLLLLVYIMFFLSGAAALVYQVVWVRSLSLIFGGSHLAITAVLSVFMAGLALGGYGIGKYVERVKKPLLLYALLEFGIALSSILFLFLIKVYPSLYIFLAQGQDHSYLFLTVIRVLFSFIVLIIPTILMGGTLPVLTRFVSSHPKNIRSSLSFLYGFNTLGAVIGAALAGFFLLRFYSVTEALLVAVLMNFLISIASLILQEKGMASLVFDELETSHGIAETPTDENADYYSRDEMASLFPFRLVLWGAGVSGFCALGYEILWTRILTVIIGASVYGFTIMLVAFLTGIGLGSASYGLLPKLFPSRGNKRADRSVQWFGCVQIVIGITALVVTLLMRELPENAIRLKNVFSNSGLNVFESRLWANFAIAYAYMVVPAFFMGVAFPLAGKVHAEYQRRVGSAVGEVLAYNTVGAILGSVASGFFLIYFFGIERSLQMLTIVNIGFGMLVISSTLRIKPLNWVVSCLTVGVVLFLALDHSSLRYWNTKRFAIYRNNQTEGLISTEMVDAVLDATDVLYYEEGLGAIISSTRLKGGVQRILVNGKIVASSSLRDQQCQLTLGHLPMLLHRNPQKVLVVGLGSGMTLGAVSIHPEVEHLTVVEIEPKVVGGARTFAEYNHHVLDNPKTRLIYNDGRNFLLTTKERYDVITADPIHPWAQGASYLYTKEYFGIASEHLSPGGIMCQWLPIYELSSDDIRSVVKTFRSKFKYTMLWLTNYDAELIGSNSEIVIDEKELEKRITGEIARDLKKVTMGSSADFLSYFVTGEEGLRNFSKGGKLITDENLHLEFSAPFSVGKPVMEGNVQEIIINRSSILPYLFPASDDKERASQEMRWSIQQEAATISDRAHALFLGNRFRTREFAYLMKTLEFKYPFFAPGVFLKDEYERELAIAPRLLQKASFSLLNERGEKVDKELSALEIFISDDMTVVIFVDDKNMLKGQMKIQGGGNKRETKNYVDGLFSRIGTVYQKEAYEAAKKRKSYPPLGPTMRGIVSLLPQPTS